MMKNAMTMIFPLNSDYMTTVRLATGGVCSLAELNLDDSEDCKVCVTESLLVFMRNGFTSARLVFTCEQGLHVQIFAEGSPTAQLSVEDEISFALLGALVSDLSMQKTDGCVSEISFRFGS